LTGNIKPTDYVFTQIIHNLIDFRFFS